MNNLEREYYKRGTKLLCLNIEDNADRDDLIIGKTYVSLGINSLGNVNINNEWHDMYGYFPWRFKPLRMKVPKHVKII